MTLLARAMGLLVGYAGVSLAFRVADLIDQLVLDAHQRTTERLAAERFAAELAGAEGAGAEGGAPA